MHEIIISGVELRGMAEGISQIHPIEITKIGKFPMQ